MTLHPALGFTGFSKSSCTKQKVCKSQDSFIGIRLGVVVVAQKKKYAYPRNLLSHIRLGLVVVARTEKYANPRNLEPVLRISKDFL